jgi:CRP-like cAMP-binding protein
MPMQDATTDERMRNCILGQLSRSQWELLQPHSEMRPLKRGKPISSPSEPGARVVFPIDCIVSLRCELADGHGSEFAMVGNEGVVGISAFTSVEAQSTDAAVQCPGRALSVRTSVMRLMFDADPAFRCIVLRYMQALLNAASQTATCYRHHGIEQQVARVLLAIHDRLDGVLLPLTHQVIAGMLGVRRIDRVCTRSHPSPRSARALRPRLRVLCTDQGRVPPYVRRTLSGIVASVL